MGGFRQFLAAVSRFEAERHDRLANKTFHSTHKHMLQSRGYEWNAQILESDEQGVFGQMVDEPATKQTMWRRP